MKFPFLAIFLIAVATLSILRNRSQKSIEQIKEDFLREEQESNSVRKQDVSGLDYITIPEEILELKFSDEEITSLIDELKRLSEMKILNLNGISNTNLKMTYGVANLEFLSKCDDNYTTLIVTLANLGEKLFDAGREKEGEIVLAFSVEIQSDVVKSYVLLKSYYEKTNNAEKIGVLKEKACCLNSIRKQSILDKLGE